VFLYSGRLSENATPVPKHVGVDTDHELCFTVFYSVLLLGDVLTVALQSREPTNQVCSLPFRNAALDNH